MSLRDFGRPLAAADVARARVERHEVAGADFELFERDRVVPGDRERCAVAAERHDPLSPSLHAEDQLQPVHAVVIVGARFDLDFLERRHLSIAGRTDDVDFGRTIVQHAHEVLRVVSVLEAVGVGQTHAIGIVRRHDKIAGEASRQASR